MGSKAKILIIDDEEDLRENLKYVFLTMGYDVELAADGAQGLKALETFIPDLIVLDLNMPNMGGFEFYRQICDGDQPKYPVFVLTARANMEQFFKDFNVDGFMAKPFEIPELLDQVAAIINPESAGPAREKGSAAGTRNVFIVENDDALMARVSGAFLMKGFTVDAAKTGADAIERMTRAVPHVACVEMNLPDIPGRIVVSRLRRMVKTARVKCILFTAGPGEPQIAADALRRRSGADRVTVVNAEKDLIDAVEGL